MIGKTVDQRHDDADSIGGLAKQLVADGRDYVAAEVDVYRQKALSWVPPIRLAAGLAVGAIMLAQASVTTLLVFVGFWLALWLGPIGGGVAAALIGFAVAGLFAWIAVRQITMKGKRA